MLHIDLHIRDLALGTGGGLVDHDLRVGQRDALALGAAGQQKRAHAGRHTDADGGHVTLDVLHGVIDSHSRGHTAAGAVDIHLNVLVGILRLQIKELRHHKAGGGIIHLFAKEYDTVIEQPGKDVVGTLAAVRLLHNVRN